MKNSIAVLPTIAVLLAFLSIFTYNQKKKDMAITETTTTELSETESTLKVTTTAKQTTAAETTATTTETTNMKPSTTFSLKATVKVKTTAKDPYIVKDLGSFYLTFYIPDDEWGYATSTGVRSKHLQTCAVDPNVIPLGSVIQIEGDNRQVITLKAVDIGGAVKGRKIDIFFDGSAWSGEQWMSEFGEAHNVYLLEE